MYLWQCLQQATCDKNTLSRGGGRRKKKKQLKVVRRCLGKQFNIKLSEVQWQYEFGGSAVESLITTGCLVVFSVNGVKQEVAEEKKRKEANLVKVPDSAPWEI